MEKVKKHNYGKLAFIFLVFGYLGSMAEKPHGMSTAEALGATVAQAAFPLAGLTFLVFWIMEKVRKGKNGGKVDSVVPIVTKEISKKHEASIQPEISQTILSNKHTNSKWKVSLNSLLKISLIVLVFVVVIVTLGFFFRVDTRYFTFSNQQCRDTALREKVDWKAKYSGVNNESALLMYNTFQSTYAGKDCSAYSSDSNYEFAKWYGKLSGGDFGDNLSQDLNGSPSLSNFTRYKIKYISVYSSAPIILSERDLCEATHKLSEVADSTFKIVCIRPSFFKQ